MDERQQRARMGRALNGNNRKELLLEQPLEQLIGHPFDSVVVSLVTQQLRETALGLLAGLLLQ